ncbi:RelA/SpoT domain-containing protein [Xenorhabdus sp. SGI240]|uniref:RelA/SpoT domain-containing protein n=1 Tax=Xenorhabdus sp. SGI240 TaxID=3158262 RepID=UPI0032B73250
MASSQYEKGKIKLLYTKSQIKKAGENIRKDENIIEAIEMIRNYRAAHLYPLTIIKNLIWKRAKKIAPKAIIARRLKRLPTIIDKLQRKTLDGKNNNSISIVRMQDIGGCRVIVKNKRELLALNRSLEISRTVHVLKNFKDYTVEKRNTGYRGIHRIYQCYGKKAFHDWKGFLIEVQLRTKLQHLWATTVEVVDLCEGKTLKTNPANSDPKWIEYFNIMSDFFADEDGFITLTIEQKSAYREKLIELNRELTARSKLLSFKSMFSGDKVKLSKGNKYVVLAINEKERNVFYKLFTSKEKEKALKLYSEIEDVEDHLGVFIHLDDVKSLQAAYPNYLIDTTFFIDKYDSFTTWVDAPSD